MGVVETLAINIKDEDGDKSQAAKVFAGPADEMILIDFDFQETWSFVVSWYLELAKKFRNAIDPIEKAAYKQMMIDVGTEMANLGCWFFIGTKKRN